MFIQKETSYPAGIGRHRAVLYAWRSALLAGTVTMPEEHPDEFFIAVEPDMDRLRTLDAAPEIKGPRFNAERNLTIYLDRYPSLDAAAERIALLESFYSRALSDHGAEQRILRAGQLHPTNAPTDKSFGAALLRALAEEVFSVLRAGKPVPFEQMTGRLFRPLANSLNIAYEETRERYADNPRKCHSVTHTYDGLARFIFLDSGTGDFPTVIRQSYNENTRDYRQTYTGPCTMDNLRRHVFDWLADAVREKMSPEDAAPLPAVITSVTPADRALLKNTDRKDVARHAFAYTLRGAQPEAGRAVLEKAGTPVITRAPFLRVVK